MQIFSIELPKYNYQTFFQEITQLTTQKIVFTPNPEILLNTRSDDEFKNILQQADYLTTDGIGIYLGFQLLDNNYNIFINALLFPVYIGNILFRKSYLYSKYGDRICGSDITKDLLDYAQEHRIKIAIIDPYFPADKAKCESQKHFRANISKVYPTLDFDFYVYKPEAQKEIISTIADSSAQILFSTLGMKKQEQSVVEIMNTAKNIKLGLGIGSSFDYFTGFQKRAPDIWRNLGFEWLYRIFTGPQKLKRIQRLYKAVILFPVTVLKNK